MTAHSAHRRKHISHHPPSTTPIPPISRPHTLNITVTPAEVLILTIALLILLALLMWLAYHALIACSRRREADRTAGSERGVGNGIRNWFTAFSGDFRKSDQEERGGERDVDRKRSLSSFWGGNSNVERDDGVEGKRLLGGVFGAIEDIDGKGHDSYMGHDRMGKLGYGGGFVDGSESSGVMVLHRDDCEGQCGTRRRSGE